MSMKYEFARLSKMVWASMEATRIEKNTIIIHFCPATTSNTHTFFNFLKIQTENEAEILFNLLDLCEISENSVGHPIHICELSEKNSQFFESPIPADVTRDIMLYPLWSCNQLMYVVQSQSLDVKIDYYRNIAEALFYQLDARRTLSNKGFFDDDHGTAYYHKWIKPSHENIEFHRTDVIQSLIDKHGYKSYLEIGFADGENFYQIECRKKYAVDPAADMKNFTCDKQCDFFYKCTSDDFFQINSSNYDLIFIDGLHTHEQVKKDIDNALNILAPNGTIILHDLNPRDWYQQAFPPQQNGDCWKAYAHLRNTRTDLEMICVNTDAGCGVIRKGKQEVYDDPNFKLDYEFFDHRRHEILNLISVENFLENL